MNRSTQLCIASLATIALGSVHTASASTLFSADFEASTAGGGATVANLGAGTATGSWTVATAASANVFADSGVTDNGLGTRKGNYDLTANFASAGALSTGVTVDFDTQLGFANSNPRSAIVTALASDGTVLFHLAFQGDNDDTDAGHFAVGYFDAGLSTWTAITPKDALNPINNGNVYKPAEMQAVSIALGASSFTLSVDGTAYSAVSYLNSASDINRLQFTEDNDGGAWYDNFNVTDVPEPGSLALMGLGGLCILRRRRG